MENSNFILEIKKVISMIKILNKAHAASIVDNEDIMPSDFEDALNLIIYKLNSIVELCSK